MNEKFQEYPCSPEVLSPDETRTFFEAKIDLAIEAYIFDCLGPQERASVNALEQRSDKVDEICWHLAKTQRQECVRKAINLRSFDVLRMIEEKTTTVGKGDEWTYHVATADPFWDGVDKAVLAFLKDSAGSFRVTDSEREIAQNEDMTVTEQKMAVYNGKSIYRKTYASIGEESPHHVVYTVCD